MRVNSPLIRTLQRMKRTEPKSGGRPSNPLLTSVINFFKMNKAQSKEHAWKWSYRIQRHLATGFQGNASPGTNNTEICDKIYQGWRTHPIYEGPCPNWKKFRALALIKRHISMDQNLVEPKRRLWASVNLKRIIHGYILQPGGQRLDFWKWSLLLQLRRIVSLFLD